jgi:hypothetical protein
MLWRHILCLTEHCGTLWHTVAWRSTIKDENMKTIRKLKKQENIHCKNKIEFIDYFNNGCINVWHCTRSVCRVRGITLLLRAGTSWRCGDGLFFEVPLLVSDALLTTLHSLLENVLQTVDHFEISCLGLPFHGWKNPEIAWGEIWTQFFVRLGKSGSVEPH